MNTQHGRPLRLEGAEFISLLPEEAGEVLHMTHFNGALVLACTGGAYALKDGELVKIEPTAEKILDVLRQTAR